VSYVYLRAGRARRFRYHLISAEGNESLCGRVSRADETVFAVRVSPLPVPESWTCQLCLAVRARTVDEVQSESVEI
jgi:hypothetical protein